RNPRDRCVKLLSELPSKSSIVGTTWENLIKSLEVVQQKGLADKLEAALKEAKNLPKSTITQEQRKKILADALQKKKDEIKSMLIAYIKLNCENTRKAWQDFLPKYKLCEIFQPLQVLKTKSTRVGEQKVDSIIQHLLDDTNRILLIE